MMRGYVTSLKVESAFAKTVRAANTANDMAERESTTHRFARRNDHFQSVRTKFEYMRSAYEALDRIRDEDLADEISLNVYGDYWTLKLMHYKGKTFARLFDDTGRAIAWTKVDAYLSDEPEAHAISSLMQKLRRKMLRMAL